MAPTSSSRILIIFSLAVALALPAVDARAISAQPADASLPSLTAFAGQMVNGEGQQLRGLYATDLFADPVVQQPRGASGFVSPAPDVLTQFNDASQLGATGLLAHNYLAGMQFSQMRAGQIVYLVYGDGRAEPYVVTQLVRYRALQPNSDYSSFVNVSTGERLSAFSLFTRMYGHSGTVVLQTCIEANGISTWGRLFVIAEPASSQQVWKTICPNCM